MSMIRSRLHSRILIGGACAVVAVLGTGCIGRGGKEAREEVAPLYSAASPAFRQATGSLLGGNFVWGNSIKTRVNGRQIFPSMLDAIRRARRTIDFETYVYWDGEIAKQFAQALSERARAGVKVNIILDAQGTQKMGSANLALLRDAGATVVKYHSVFWLDPRRYNNRSHRKLLIIDGREAFVGGVGIADEWLGNGETPKEWRDNH